jgi:hypothetical protein
MLCLRASRYLAAWRGFQQPEQNRPAVGCRFPDRSLGEDSMPKGPWTIGEQAEEFFSQIGIAITQWSEIDVLLFHVCRKIVGCDGRHAAIIYYRISTLDMRLQLAEEFVRSVIPGRKSGDHPTPFEKNWISIAKSIRDGLPIRNQLAHCPATPQTERPSPGKTVADLDYWWASYVSGAENLRGRPRAPNKDLKVSDIKKHVTSVKDIYLKLRSFVSFLPEPPESHSPPRYLPLSVLSP